MVDACAPVTPSPPPPPRHPEAFPNFYVGILESAELTGNLDGVLNQLADYIDRDQKARGKVTAALIYPAVVSAMSVVTVIVLAVFVLPRFVVVLQLPAREVPAGHADAAEHLVVHLARGGTSSFAVIILIVGGFIAMHRSRRGQGAPRQDRS